MSDVLDANLAELLRRAYVPALPAAEFRTRLEKSLRTELARKRGTFSRGRPWSRPLLALAAAIAMLLAGGLFWLAREGPGEDCGAILARGELAWRAAAEEPWRSLPASRAERGFDLLAGTLELATPVEVGTEVRLPAGSAELAAASRAAFDAAGSALVLHEGSLALEHGAGAPPWRLATREGVLAIGSAELVVALGSRGLQVRVERGSVWFEDGDGRTALAPGREAWLSDGALLDAGASSVAIAPSELPADGRRAIEPDPLAAAPEPPLAALDGRVRGPADGVRVTRFTVALVRQREEHDFFSPIVREFEDAAGRFRWEGVQAHAFEVFVHADGHAVRHAGTIDGRAKEPLAALEIELERGSTRSGRVVDAQTGDPIAGALVMSEEDTAAFGLPFRMESEQAEAGNAFFPTAALSGPDGGFVLEHISTGRHRLRVTASGYGVAYSKRIDTAAGDAGEPLLFALQSGATIRGRVTDMKGEPAGGRRLIVTPMESDLDPHRQMSFALVETDATGSYAATDLPGGEMLVILIGESPNEALNEVKAAVVAPGADVRVDFEGEKTGTRVVGRLLDAAGAPLPSRNLAIYRCVNGTLDYLSFVGTSSDEEGRFEFEGLPPGPHRVFLIGSMGRTIQWIEEIEVLEMVEQTQDLELSLGAIEGTTRSGLDESALPRSVIVIQRHLDEEGVLEFAGWILADAEGRFRFAGLPFGVYELSAYAVTDDFGFEHTEAFGLDASAASKTLELRHYPGGQVRVLVVDASGTPVAGAAVNFLDERGREFGFDRNPVTDDQGVHLARGCRPGPFTVVALCTDGRRGTSPLDCKIGQMNEVKITLEAPSESAK